MRKRKNLFIAISCSLLATNSFAAPPPLCASPELLLESTGGCAGNSAFVDAANACLAKLNAEEATLGKKIEDAANLAKQGQSKDTSAAREGYASTVQAMNQLRTLAEQGRAELSTFEHFLALPSPEQASLHSPDGSLNMDGALQASCYAGGMLGVRAAEKDFENKIATYDKRSAEAVVAAKALGINLGNLQALTSVAKPLKGRGRAQPVPTGQPKQRESQVTGKVKDVELP